MVRFSLLELKGEYDFNTSNSEYKGDLFIGNAKLKMKHSLKTNCPKFELEGPMWEVGYCHKNQLAHFKKKFQLSRNFLLVLRQDLPKMNFGVVPSPEIQLEHTVKNVLGCQKQKLELKFDTFWKRLTIEEEATFGQFYKMKAAINSKTIARIRQPKMRPTTELLLQMWDGAFLSLKAEPKAPFANEMEMKLSPSKPAVLQYKIVPMRGLKLKLVTDTKSKKVSAEVEAEFLSEGMKVELKQFVSGKGWSQPLLGISYKF